jgi:hypothetical protein
MVTIDTVFAIHYSISSLIFVNRILLQLGPYNGRPTIQRVLIVYTVKFGQKLGKRISSLVRSRADNCFYCCSGISLFLHLKNQNQFF